MDYYWFSIGIGCFAASLMAIDKGMPVSKLWKVIALSLCLMLGSGIARDCADVFGIQFSPGYVHVLQGLEIAFVVGIALQAYRQSRLKAVSQRVIGS